MARTSVKQKIRLDELDVKIIKELQADARISFRELARKLGVSVTTVSGRVKKMINAGFIRSFTAIVDPEKVGPLFCASLYIKTENGTDPKKTGEKISAIDGICYVYNTVGIHDLIALGSAISRDALSEMIRRVSSTAGVREVIASMVINTIKEDPKHPVVLER